MKSKNFPVGHRCCMACSNLTIHNCLRTRFIRGSLSRHDTSLMSKREEIDWRCRSLYDQAGGADQSWRNMLPKREITLASTDESCFALTCLIQTTALQRKIRNYAPYFCHRARWICQTICVKRGVYKPCVSAGYVEI